MAIDDLYNQTDPARMADARPDQVIALDLDQTINILKGMLSKMYFSPIVYAIEIAQVVALLQTFETNPVQMIQIINTTLKDS